MTCENLGILLKCLPFEARSRFYSLELGGTVSISPKSLEEEIREALPRIPREKRKELIILLVNSLVSVEEDRLSSIVF